MNGASKKHSGVTRSQDTREKKKRTEMLHKTHGPTNPPGRALNCCRSTSSTINAAICLWKNLLEMTHVQNDPSLARQQLMRFYFWCGGSRAPVYFCIGAKSCRLFSCCHWCKWHRQLELIHLLNLSCPFLGMLVEQFCPVEFILKFRRSFIY